MGTINRVPDGLLGLLDAKTLGQTPSQTLDVLSPVIDLKDFYAANLVLEVTSATSVGETTVGTSAEVTVPNGEMWFVHSFAAVAFLTAGGGGTMQLTGRITVAAGSFIEFTSNQKGPNAAGESMSQTESFSPILMAPPGTEFSTNLQRVAAGSTYTTITEVLHRVVQV